MPLQGGGDSISGVAGAQPWRAQSVEGNSGSEEEEVNGIWDRIESGMVEVVKRFFFLMC